MNSAMAGLNSMLPNAMSIDVEEYFQVSGFENVIDRDQWDSIPSRLEIGMSYLLQTFARYNIQATFFFLGWIVERHPAWLTRVADAGHEIAIHGYDHRLIYHQTPAEFAADIRKTLSIVRAHYDGPILGYRAPSFSVRTDTLWALEILKEQAIRYDSSIFPFKRKRYGIENAPTEPYEVLPALLEFPMSTVKVLGKAVPVAGGGYFRMYPSWCTHWAIRSINQAGRPAVCYMHPWEFDPDQPRVAADRGNAFRHRVNLPRTRQKFERLCQSFAFAPLRQVLKL
jgi:polysaccharide deacetylase family protein (PEP-CTERM system associated)